MADMKYFRRKICLLGDAAVGKTSLIRRYVEDQFNDKYVVTLGTKVTMRELVVQGSEKKSNVKLTLMIWDILGQREYKRLQTSFYKGANGALIVADSTRRETLDSINGWILSLFNSVGKVPVLILLNKSDLTDQSAISPAEVEDIAKKYDTSFLTTSAKTGENVESAFLKLSEMLVFKGEAIGASKEEDAESKPSLVKEAAKSKKTEAESPKGEDDKD
jgi:small GTP-binding protein